MDYNREPTVLSSSVAHSSSAYLLSATLGILSHHCIFKHGEWHMKTLSILKCHIIAFLFAALVELAYGSGNITDSLWVSTSNMWMYVSALLTSMTIYRKFFHRLRGFPGPWMAGATKLWHLYQCTNSQNHLLLDAMYQKYGQFVRTGPEELTIFHPEVLRAVDGPGNHCTKAVWYDLLLPEIAVNTTRSKSEHDKRRRIWDHGFTTKAINYYEERMMKHGAVLERAISDLAQRDQPVNVSNWFYWFTFDVMGEFAFARSFGMLEDKKWHNAVIMLRKAMRLLGPLSPVPWLAQLGFNIFPWFCVVRDWFSMLAWCRERMKERIQITDERPDVSKWLIDASRRTNSLDEDRPWLYGDAVTIIIAGSDTVAPTLVFIFYELALHRREQQKLFEELNSIDVYEPAALRALPHLNGVINESLRIHPPVPTGGYRQTPKEGMEIAGKYIPGNVTIVAPRYTLGKLEGCFVQAEEFIPERWYSKREMIKDERAFSPFAQGRYGCVGKNLALSELRFVAALLIKHYVVCFASGENGKSIVNDLRDQFTAAPRELNLSFKLR